MKEPKIVGLCVLCEIPMCSAKIKPPPGAWYDKHKGRRLCGGCYGVHYRRGTLDDFERLTRPRADTFDDWLLLKSTGATRREAADRMGMSLEALDRVRYLIAAERGVSLRSLGPVERVTEPR